MPNSRTTGKSVRGANTHAHYAGEFGGIGRQELTKELGKSPEYRAERARYFAHVAKNAASRATDARLQGKRSEAAEHALVAAHAMKRAAEHAKAASKMAPGTTHAATARAAADEAKAHHDSLENKHFDAKTATKASDDFGDRLARMTHGTGASKVVVSGSEAALQSAIQKSRDTTHARSEANVGVQSQKKSFDEVIAQFGKDKRLADKASEKAHKITALARVSNSSAEAHADAASAHTAAAKAHEAIGDVAMAQSHAMKAEKLMETSRKMARTDAASTTHAHVSDEHLAEMVQRVTDQAPARHGFGREKVFIHRVHEALATHLPGMSLPEFKSRLESMSQKGLVKLSRADLAGAMNKHDVATSSTRGDDSDTRNFVSRSASAHLKDEVVQEHMQRMDSMSEDWRQKKFDHAGRDITSPKPASAEPEKIGKISDIKVGDRIKLGGWDTTVHAIYDDGKGKKVFDTGSGNIHQDSLKHYK